MRPIEKFAIPEYKYVFCSLAMIKQIENAFCQDEVSFPPENFAHYLEQLVHNKNQVKKDLEEFGTFIKYHHNFNNISIIQRGQNQNLNPRGNKQLPLEKSSSSSAEK